MAKDKRLKTVVRFTNGTVAVFGYDGQQMPDYQGEWSRVRDAIERDSDNDTNFQITDWDTEVRPFLNKQEA